MALDSADKRAAAIGFKQATVPIYPTPDGELSAADRQFVAHEYPGIAAGLPPVVTGPGPTMLWHHHYGV